MLKKLSRTYDGYLTKCLPFAILLYSSLSTGRLYLNRQAITLLSGRGIKDNVFKKLQEDMLYDLGRMFFYNDKAAESLSTRASQQISINYRKIAEAGISLTTEPFFRGLLLAVYRNSIGEIRST